MGNVAAGMALYNSTCINCHGTSKASDPKVNTVAGLTTVMGSVSSHSSLNTSLTTQNRLDLAAYIASAK